MKFLFKLAVITFMASSICIYAGCFPSIVKNTSPIVYNHNLDNEQTFNIRMANYSNTPVITVTQSELNNYEVFNYLHGNAIQESQPAKYYFDRMMELRNSLIKLNSNIANNIIPQQRIKILYGYFGEILDYIITEAEKQYLRSNDKIIACKLDDFRILYYQILDNNENMTNEQISKMYNEFTDIFSNNTIKLYTQKSLYY